MKKLLCCIIAAAMIFALTACQTSESTPSASASAESASAPAESASAASESASASTVSEASPGTSSGVTVPSDLPKKKIGVVYMTFADKLGSQFKSSLESLAQTFNVEFTFIETGMSQEQGQAAVDSAIQSGLDGLLVIPASVSIVDSAQKAGVAVAGFCSEPVADQVQQLPAYDNYVGTVADNNYNIGLHAADALYSAGCRKIGIIGLTQGLAQNADDRIRGIRDGVANHADMQIIGENMSMGEWAKGVSSLAAAYPEMDGLFVNSADESVYQAMNNEGLIGTVKLATVDVSQSTKDYFDNGTLVYIAGGQYGTIMTSFAALYNYLYDGTKLIPDTTKPVLREHVELTNIADYEAYAMVVDGATPVYTPDEIAAMIKGFNPGFSFEAFTKLCDEYSLTDVTTRHPELLK
jgi:ABC-type sugar transport system substrate-binding protein